MGVNSSVSSVVNVVNNTINNYIENRAKASSEADCLIQIENITISKSKNCSIKVANNCVAKSDAQLTNSAELAANIYNNLNNDQKTPVAAALLQMSISSAVNVTTTDISNKVKQICESEAKTEERIVTKNIIIDQCEATEPLYMTFINTGSAASNCVSNLAVQLAAQISTDIVNKQSGGFSLENIVLYLGIFAVFATLVYYSYLIISKYVKTAEEIIHINKYSRNDWVGRRNSLLNIKKIVDE